MKTQNSLDSLATLARYAVATTLSLAASLFPAIAAAAEDDSLGPVASLDPGINSMPASGVPQANGVPATSAAPQMDSLSHQSARASTAGKYTGYSLNFTPVLLAPHGDERLGGGVDPELKYTLDRGAVRLSAGLRVGGYYAKNLFGITAMPTLRLVVPVGPVEPYASFGMGYGWLPKSERSGVATMSRLGVVFRFSQKFSLGVEGTIQKIDRSAFEFPSFGSAVSLNF